MPSLAGFLSDITSSYHESFYFSGATVAACTCLLFVVPVFVPNYKRHGVIEEVRMGESQEKSSKSILDRYVRRYFSVSQGEPCNAGEYFIVVDKVSSV